MKLKILSWNDRRMNNCDKRKVIKAFIRTQRADLVCLQEMKIQVMSIEVVPSLGVGRFLEKGGVNTNGIAGRILLFWGSRVLELNGIEVGHFSIFCHFGNCEDGFQWIF